MKMKIYIGCSESDKAQGFAQEIAEILEAKKHELEFGDISPSRFKPAETPADKYGAAIFIFTEEDKSMNGGNHFTVWDKVAIEYGCFINALGEQRVLACIDRELITGDIARINLLEPHKARNHINKFLDNIDPTTDIERVLMHKDKSKSVLITLPTPPPSGKDKRESVLLADVELTMELVQQVGEKHSFKMNLEQDDFIEGAYGSEIHYGTPSTSYFVSMYISLFIKNFKWRITEKNYKDFGFVKHNGILFDPEIRELIKDDDENGWQGFSFWEKEKYVFEYGKQDYAFLLRLNENSFPSSPRTVHVLFGIGEDGRRVALKYFLANLKHIHETYPRDYLLVSKVGSGVFVDIYPRKPADSTDDG